MASSTKSSSSAAINKPAKQSKEFVWTDDEVELLLGVINDYKTEKAGEAIDWESVKNKYADILSLFIAHLPQEGEETVRTILTRENRSPKRQLHPRSKPSGLSLGKQWRIWGGNPATEQLGRGIESTDIMAQD